MLKYAYLILVDYVPVITIIVVISITTIVIITQFYTNVRTVLVRNWIQ